MEWPAEGRLRVGGVRTSRRCVLRLMREHDLLAPGRVGRPRGPCNHDGTIIPDAVDAMWGTDMTTTWTGEGQAVVFVAIDHHSAGCVGLHAARRGVALSSTGRNPPMSMLMRRASDERTWSWSSSSTSIPLV